MGNIREESVKDELPHFFNEKDNVDIIGSNIFGKLAEDNGASLEYQAEMVDWGGILEEPLPGDESGRSNIELNRRFVAVGAILALLLIMIVLSYIFSHGA